MFFVMKQETMCLSDFAFLEKHKLHIGQALRIFEMGKFILRYGNRETFFIHGHLKHVSSCHIFLRTVIHTLNTYKVSSHHERWQHVHLV